MLKPWTLAEDIFSPQGFKQKLVWLPAPPSTPIWGSSKGVVGEPTGCSSLPRREFVPAHLAPTCSDLWGEMPIREPIPRLERVKESPSTEYSVVGGVNQTLTDKSEETNLPRWDTNASLILELPCVAPPYISRDRASSQNLSNTFVQRDSEVFSAAFDEPRIPALPATLLGPALNPSTDMHKVRYLTCSLQLCPVFLPGKLHTPPTQTRLWP